MSTRSASLSRDTKETKIEVRLDIDGTGKSSVETGIPFLDHMLELFAGHSQFDLNISAKGDLEVDAHHTVEDVGICLGQAFRKTLGDKKGISRYGDVLMPMDEALVMVALDISGRPHLIYEVPMPVELIGNYDTSLTVDFLHAFVNHAAITLHVKLMAGRNAHHIVEAVFKGLARCLDAATRADRRTDAVPSTKGSL